MKCQHEGVCWRLAKSAWKVALISEERLDGDVPENTGAGSLGGATKSQTGDGKALRPVANSKPACPVSSLAISQAVVERSCLGQ